MGDLTTLRPAAAGDLTEVTEYTGGASVLACISDDTDDNYISALAGSGGKRGSWTPEAHGLAAGTTVNSVTLHYRCKQEASFAQYKPLWKRDGDAEETSGAPNAETDWTTHETVITAPDGGWTLEALANVQFGVQLEPGADTPHHVHCTKIWLVVDSDPPPAATFKPITTEY